MITGHIKLYGWTLNAQFRDDRRGQPSKLMTAVRADEQRHQERRRRRRSVGLTDEETSLVLVDVQHEDNGRLTGSVNMEVR